MDIDVAVIQKAFVERITLDMLPESLAFRQQFATYRGTARDNTDGMMHARRLVDPDRPVRPLLAYRGGTLASRSRIIYVFTLRWFLYDDPGQGYWRINTLIPLLSRALTAAPKVQIATNKIGEISVGGASGETHDGALNLNYRYVALSADVV